jgi:hypothetical protein
LQAHSVREDDVGEDTVADDDEFMVEDRRTERREVGADRGDTRVRRFEGLVLQDGDA